MKTKILLIGLVAIVLLLNVAKVSAQDAIEVSVYQDAKLALIEDGHSNKPFTPDLQFKLSLQGNDSYTGFLQVGVKYEWADLYGGDYSRFGVEAGYAFHTYILKIDVAPMVGYGYAYRFGGRYDNFEFSAEIDLPITKNLSVGYLFTISQRKELKDAPWRYNGAVGLKYKFSTDYGSRQAQKGSRF
jgi:hypothetical protein